MKLYLCLVLCFVLGVVLSNVYAAQPPTLARQFVTNFTLSAVNWVQPGQALITGHLALDDKNGGGFLSIGGEEFIPLYFHTNAIAHPLPSSGQITGYIFEGSICLSGNVSQEWLHLFPLSIPADATYLGERVVNNIKCGVWEWTPYGSYEINMWVNEESTPYGNGIVQILLKQAPYVGDVLWAFKDTTVGPFSPSIYNPPALNCKAIPYGSPGAAAFQGRYDEYLFQMLMRL